MQKYLYIILFSLFTLTCSAQIQKKFFGFTIGVTNTTTVANYLKTNHIKYSVENGEYRAEKIKFAGEVWDCIWFTFYQGKLYNIDLSISDYSTPIATMNLIHKRIKDSLENKYSEYYNYNSTDEKTMFSDGVIEITLTNRYFEGSKSIGLMYTYLPLLNQRLKAADDEL